MEKYEAMKTELDSTKHLVKLLIDFIKRLEDTNARQSLYAQEHLTFEISSNTDRPLLSFISPKDNQKNQSVIDFEEFDEVDQNKIEILKSPDISPRIRRRNNQKRNSYKKADSKGRKTFEDSSQIESKIVFENRSKICFGKEQFYNLLNIKYQISGEFAEFDFNNIIALDEGKYFIYLVDINKQLNLI